MADNNI